MASFARSVLPPRQREWTVEEHALFAARKEFELLRLLSTDKRALATARRLGFSTTVAQPQPHSHSGAAHRAPQRERRQVVVAATPRRNARQRRSARRSAERHRKRQLIIRSRILCLLFVIRLRRRVRARRDLGDLDELASQSSQEAVAKRDRPSSRSDSDTTESSGDPLEYEHHHVLGLARVFGSTRAPPMKRAGREMWQSSHALLR